MADQYSSSSIQALIVDDEKNACINLRNMLLEYADPSINILGMAHNTKEAEKKIQQLSPNVVFLDIEMPNENAFQFLSRISPVNFEIVFVTAYDEFALNAFKQNAVDYIMKPISIPEIKNAVLKVRERLNFKRIVNEQTPYTDLYDQVNRKIRSHKVTLKDCNRVEVVDFSDICFVEALGSYSKIQFVKGNEVQEMTMSNPLSDYENMLPADMFYRIHRSYLINSAHIKKIFHDGSNQLMTIEGSLLPVSRRRYPLLIEYLKVATVKK